MEHKNDIILLSSRGIANSLVFKSKASSILHIQMLEDEDEGNLQSIAKKIVSEIKSIFYDKDEYQSKIDLTSCQQDVSPSLAKLLSYVSPHLSDNSLPSILIGNIVTSMASNRYTSLQFGLAIIMREKQLVSQFYDYGVVCSYDELVRFRTSAAAGSAKKQSHGIPSHHSNGLVQAVTDNFDCNISSMKGLQQTHSLAIMMLQSACKPEMVSEIIPRLKKTELKDAYLPVIETVQYIGPKKKELPVAECIQIVQPLKILAKTATALKIASDYDLGFMKTVTKDKLIQSILGTTPSLLVRVGGEYRMQQ